MADKRSIIEQGETTLGIELGSTRIKAVLIDRTGEILAVGYHNWESTLVDGLWSYSREDILDGLHKSYVALKKEVFNAYRVTITKIGMIGISAMMHGIIALDKDKNFLLPFRTWRNTNTQDAADRLTTICNFNIPLRWSISHLFQLALEKNEAIEQLDYVATLAAYVHFLLTGERVLGVGDASGMFPIDPETCDYDAQMFGDVEDLPVLARYSWRLRDVMPRVLSAGADAGKLSAVGARLLDPTGDLEHGIPLCPPEGDAGTGMVATNAVAVGTGNISAGTSTFIMVVLARQLRELYRDIDIVTTPAGHAVAMAHANNGTADINAWVGLLGEFARLTGKDLSQGELFELLFRHSLEGDVDCGEVLSYGYFAAEPTVGVEVGRPVLMRSAEGRLSLANFMRSHIYGALAVTQIGLKALLDAEDMSIDRMHAHGGLFATPGVAQQYLADALNVPVSVQETANEGGAWGIALLAAYALWGKETEAGEAQSLAAYLEREIFASAEASILEPRPEGVEGFRRYVSAYTKGLRVLR